MSHSKRKVDKGYSGRLLETDNQVNSKQRQHISSSEKRHDSMSTQPKYLSRTKTMKMKSYFSLFPDRRSSPHRTTSKPRHWTSDEDDRLKKAVKLFGEKKWKQIAEQVPNRNHTQCLQRWSKVLAPGLKKGQWSRDEDEALVVLVSEELKFAKFKDGKPKLNWGKISKSVLGRTAKQCRERWVNNLDPNITKCSWTEDEVGIFVLLIFRIYYFCNFKKSIPKDGLQ